MLVPGLIRTDFLAACERRNQARKQGSPIGWSISIYSAREACSHLSAGLRSHGAVPCGGGTGRILRPQGIDVLPIDANLEGFLALLQREAIGPALRPHRAAHRQPATSARARPPEPTRIVDAVARARRGRHGAGRDWRGAGHLAQPRALLRSRAVRRRGYHGQRSLRVIAAAHAPMQLDFTAYRTPFALTTPDEIARDADPERDPFDGYLMRELVPRLRRARVDAIGLSVCFPGQLVPAYSFALKLKPPFPRRTWWLAGRRLPRYCYGCRGRHSRRGWGRLTARWSSRASTPCWRCVALWPGARTARALARIPNLVLRDPLLGRAHSARAARCRSAQPARARLRRPAARLAICRPIAAALRSHPRLLLGPLCLLPLRPGRTGTARYRERAVDTVVEHLSALSVRHNILHSRGVSGPDQRHPGVRRSRAALKPARRRRRFPWTSLTCQWQRRPHILFVFGPDQRNFCGCRLALAGKRAVARCSSIPIW